MRSLFAFLGGALVAFLVLGYFFNWYSISRTPTDETGRMRFEFDLNAKKVKDDVSKGAKATADKIDGVINKKTASTTPTSTGNVQPPP